MYPPLVACKVDQIGSDSDGEDVIGESGGMERFLAELGVDPEDVLTLIIAWIFKASTLGEFSRQEWTEALTFLKYRPPSRQLLHFLSAAFILLVDLTDGLSWWPRCDSIAKMKEKLPAWRAMLRDENHFKDFYIFVFTYAKDSKSKNIGTLHSLIKKEEYIQHPTLANFSL